MATYTRNNAWNNGGDFTNPDLLWYAKGVRKMMSRALDDKASWWFFAAIHGEYVNPATAWYVNPPAFPDWGFITSPPSVPTSPLPDQATQDLYWNQCQHQSWYFPPWHRGYLLALEAQLRLDIIAEGGPESWALPYWNYFGGLAGAQYKMPPALAAETLPDGTANPLYVRMRFGPDLNSDIYIPTPAGAAAHPGDPNYSRGIVREDCLANDLYTGSDAITDPPGFGGPATGFNHDGGTSGNLEANPHNLVHVYVGGLISKTEFGLMANPGTAALDPVFYLHHANIDRLWAVWNANGNPNPTDLPWVDGPTQKFVMPWTDGNPWYYTPLQVENLNELNYTYQELTARPKVYAAAVAQRLNLLGAAAAAEKVTGGIVARTVPKRTELLGANESPLRIQGHGSQTVVKLDAAVRTKVSASFALTSEVALPDQVFLKVENVRGTTDAAVLDVFVNLPAHAQPGGTQEALVGSMALFGLHRASVKDGPHGGEGLTFIHNITRKIDELHLAQTFDVSTLRVTVVPSRPLPADADITIGRISVFRQGAR